MGALAIKISRRPCEIAGYVGSDLERLFFDIAVIKSTLEEQAPESSTRGRIMRRRAQTGLYT